MKLVGHFREVALVTIASSIVLRLDIIFVKYIIESFSVPKRYLGIAEIFKGGKVRHTSQTTIFFWIVRTH